MIFRKLVSDPAIYKRYISNLNRINRIPVYKTIQYAHRVERPISDTPFDAVSNNDMSCDTFTLTADVDWPSLVYFPEQLLDVTRQIYCVIVDFDYYKTHLQSGKMPELDIDIKTIPHPIIVPYNDPYGYNSRVYTKEQLYAIEESQHGDRYIIRSATNFNAPSLTLDTTNLYPGTNESYSACFTDEHIAKAYAISVERFIKQMVNVWTNRTWT